jgi:hypothetical protein
MSKSLSAATLLLAQLFNFDSAGAAMQSESSQPPKQARHVIVNRVSLADKEVEALENAFRVRIVDGSFWYDRATGAWGIEGGPTLGFLVAGLKMGGPLRADASKGNTKVFINGRELHLIDVIGLQQLGPVSPGRYWVDAVGNCGYEGGPAFVNLMALARSRGQVNYTKYGTIGADANGTPFFHGRDALGRDGSR